MTLPETCLCGQSVCPRCFPGLADSHPYAQLRARMSPAAQAQAAAQAHALLAAMPDLCPASLPGGWSLWAYPVADDSPYLHRHVEIWRQEWATPRVVSPRILPPQMNVEGLYWRPLRARCEEDTPHAC